MGLSSGCRPVKSLGLALISALALLAFAPLAHATFPGVNGKIVFERDNHIRTMNPDGTGQSELRVSRIGLSPAWSPDGGRIAFVNPLSPTGQELIYTMKADGSDLRQVTPETSYDVAISDTQPAWSPDGQKIAFASNRGCVTHCDGLDIYTINADGTGMAGLTSEGAVATNGDPAWSPDGQTIAFDRNVRSPDASAYEIDTMKPDGSGRATVTQGLDPNWSPDGRKLAFAATLAPNGPADLYVANADGTGRTNLTNSPAANENQPAWSPDGTKIAFVTNQDGNDEIYSMNSGGTGATNLTQNPANDETPDWQPISPTAPKHTTATSVSCSPNPVAVGRSTTCAATVSDTAPSGQTAPAGAASFTSDGAGSFTASSCTLSASSASSSCQVTYTPSAVGSGTHKITATYGGDPTHDPSSGAASVTVSTGGYPRPKGATPFQTYLVPAFKQCTAVNRTHGSPLAFPSCRPPVQASSFLTVGTPDANGQGAKSRGWVLMRAFSCPACVGPGPNADVRLDVSITDVRNRGDLSDYTGQLQADAALRITDKNNTPSAGGPGPGTVSDTHFPFAVPCAATSDTTIGSTCSVSTSANAVMPGSVQAGYRAIWDLGQVKVFDGGASGVAGSSDARLFMDEGIFVP